MKYIQSFYSRILGLLIAVCLFIPSTLWGESYNPILIISSYNPDTPLTSNNITDFITEYKQLGGKSDILIENMNCKSFSEAQDWSSIMREYLLKYQGQNKPALILLLGQEAWSAYISQSNEVADPTIPVLCGMVSRNAILLPEQGIDMRGWEPESVDVMDDLNKNNIVSGFLYEYNVDKNMQMIKKLYPQTQTIAFLSDNSYGGVSIQAYFKKQFRNYPDFNLVLLDGRKDSFQDILTRIEKLPANSALIVGTWRVDVDNNWFINNMQDITSANPQVPCFSLTSIRGGEGLLGGYIPQYRGVGKDLALQALEYIDSSSLHNRSMQYVPNKYIFDYKKITSLGFKESDLPSQYELTNKEESFLSRYRNQFIAVASLFVILLIGYLVVFYYFLRVKRLKDALQQSENDNILILNNLRAEVKYITPDYQVKWSNNLEDGAMRRSADEGQGYFCYKSIYGFDKPCDYCPVPEAVATGKSTENTIEFPNNKYVTMLASPVYDDITSELVGVVVRSEDVSKDKERERELRIAKERAEESDRLKSAFLANMSHEIRTPLNAIVGFSTVLTAESTSEEERQAYSQIIQTNSDLLLRLINDILDISRLETGKLTFNMAPCEIVTMCNSVLSTTQYIRKNDVKYILDAPFESFELMTDIQRLQQVLINLMSNAAKFTTVGSITLGVRLDKEADMMVFSVTDTGCGIPKDKQKLVFERFEKLNEYAQGTGLGLAICKVTVEMLGGQIWVDGDYEGGARFIFTHPLNPKIKRNESVQTADADDMIRL